MSIAIATPDAIAMPLPSRATRNTTMDARRSCLKFEPIGCSSVGCLSDVCALFFPQEAVLPDAKRRSPFLQRRGRPGTAFRRLFDTVGNSDRDLLDASAEWTESDVKSVAAVAQLAGQRAPPSSF